MPNQLNQRIYRGISLIELVLVLVAIGFVTLSGIQFIAGRIEQNKVRRAADQIEGWLLAAQAYYRDHVQADPQPPSLWPQSMSDMYQYIAADTVSDKFNSGNTRTNPNIDPWGYEYQPQPPTNGYTPPQSWQSANVLPKMDKNYPNGFFFTLQVPVANTKRGLAIIAQLPNARFATDSNGKLIKSNDNYLINAFIPPPSVIASSISHQLVVNMGVVKTKLNDLAAKHNYYNYTIDDYLTDYDSAYTSIHYLRPESVSRAHGGTGKLTHDQIRHYGAVFVAKPKCPSDTEAYIQASIAGFGITDGYSSRYNNDRPPLPIGSKSTFQPLPAKASLYSTTPVPYTHGNRTTTTPNLGDSYFPYFTIDENPSDPNYYYGSNDAKNDYANGDLMSIVNKALGGIIGTHVKAAEQNFVDDDDLQSENDNDSGTPGWYLWLDITANMAMYPNYPDNTLPSVITDCAMNINTRSSEFDYNKYNYIPKNPMLTGDGSDQTAGPMLATDLIMRSIIPLYRPSPCHFHSGYIAYIVSCAPPGLAKANGLTDAVAKLTS